MARESLPPELLSAIDALVMAAKRREYSMGDPSALVAAKANLRAAVARVEELLAPSEPAAMKIHTMLHPSDASELKSLLALYGSKHEHDRIGALDPERLIDNLRFLYNFTPDEARYIVRQVEKAGRTRAGYDWVKALGIKVRASLF